MHVNNNAALYNTFQNYTTTTFISEGDTNILLELCMCARVHVPMHVCTNMKHLSLPFHKHLIYLPDDELLLGDNVVQMLQDGNGYYDNRALII